jgi:midasin (ATPase involved in ribosome maturation)
MKSSQNCQETIFQFNNGVLTHAIKKGYIIIWDKIEQCKPQVLEKCNSLGEEGGVLFINEIGSS